MSNEIKPTPINDPAKATVADYLTGYEETMLTPLVDFAQKIKEADPNSTHNILSLSEEVIAAKHTLTYFRPIIEQYIKKITRLEQKPNRTREENAQLRADLFMLQDLGKDFQKSIDTVSSIVRKAAELEAVKASRFDSLQLIYMLRQIPDLIADTLFVAITEVIEEILRHFKDGGDINDCRYLCTARTLAINEKVQETLAKVTAQIDQVDVLQRSQSDGSDLAVQASDVQRQYEEMEETVPGPPE